MKKEKRILCPECDSKYTDLISYVYRCLESENAGQKLFSDNIDSEISKKKKFPELKKETLLKKLAPPKESKVSFPAATVALMAFLASWLVVGSILSSRIGETFYFYLTLLIVGGLAYPFYSTMKLIIKQVRINYAKYKKEKSLWVKKYFCYDCDHIFTPNLKKKSSK